MPEGAIKYQLSKLDEGNGINLFHVKTGKFKTSSINILFYDTLNEANATKNALVPRVMMRGTKKFPAYQELSRYLEELYGASFDCGVNKKGELHIMNFTIDFINERYTGQKENLFTKAFELVSEIIMNPVAGSEILTDRGYGSFKQEYVSREKENLKNLIEGRVNDKYQYAVDRCFEEMCRGERYAIYNYGRVEDLASIDEKNLYSHYEYILNSMTADIYVVGDVGPGVIQEAFTKCFKLNRTKVNEPLPSEIKPQSGEVKKVFDKMNVNQGKLSMGFRTGIAPWDEDYYALVVMNGILGGGMHSKLFQNVREKASLAYYAVSRIDKFKGLMMVSSGIEVANYQKTVDIIMQQIEDIKAGNISEWEYESTLKSFETGLKSLTDSQFQIVDFYISQQLSRSDLGFEDLIKRINGTSIDDVKKVAEKVKLDTIYFLTNAD